MVLMAKFSTPQHAMKYNLRVKGRGMISEIDVYWVNVLGAVLDIFSNDVE